MTDLDIEKLNSTKGLISLLMKSPLNVDRALRYVRYEKKLKKLQVELIRMQKWAIETNQRIIVIFEGRDAAGKGGAIRRITERINPRHFQVVALRKPSLEERGQWYFERYIPKFPKRGELVFFDRSWYNRAIVEPVNGFCGPQEYEDFMKQVDDFERMITDSGIKLIKIYMSISKKEQQKRFDDLREDPLKQWKLTQVDEDAQKLWDNYTDYKNRLFENTKEKEGIPWKVIEANKKTEARIESIKYILEQIPYDKNIEI
jgi:polyphosphate kinase 2